MKTHVLFYTYLFFNQLSINIKKDVLGSRLLLSLVQSNGMSFLIKQRLYNYVFKSQGPQDNFGSSFAKWNGLFQYVWK
jgi:hypothetical protein